jgi:hypothetical protein
MSDISRSPSDAVPRAFVPPVIVALVRNDAAVTTAMFLQTLFGLAEVGWLEIEGRTSPEPMVRIVRSSEPGDSTLRGYEEVALRRVAERMGEQPDVPLSALTDQGGRSDWWRSYTRAVMKDAQAAGLVRRLIGERGIFAVMGGSAALFGYLTAGMGTSIAFTVVIALATGLFPGLYVGALLRKARLTRAGRALLRQVSKDLVAGDTSAIGTVEPLAPEAVSLAPDQLWSSYGGRWRTLKVPEAPSRARALRVAGSEGGELVGQVVKQWTEERRSGGDGNTATFHFCCIDDGVSAEGRSLAVSCSEYKQMTVGSVVTVTFNPLQVSPR